LVLATIGPTLAKLEGQVIFENDVVLDVWELVDFAAGQIRNYSYEIYQSGKKIAWYDPFEHPHIAELASTYPHINTYLLISNTTGSQRLVLALNNLICPL